jgi:hypothetical protein
LDAFSAMARRSSGVIFCARANPPTRPRADIATDISLSPIFVGRFMLTTIYPCAKVKQA